MINSSEISSIRTELLKLYGELPSSEAELAEELLSLTKSLDPDYLNQLAPAVLGILGAPSDSKRLLSLRLAKGRADSLKLQGASPLEALIPTGFFPGAALRLTSRPPQHPNFPVTISLMGDFSLARLLARLRRVCPDSLEFDVEKLSFLLSRAQMPGNRQPVLPWPPGGAVRFKEYFNHNYLSFAQKALLDKYYWPSFPTRLANDDAGIRAELLSYLWGSSRPLTSL